MEKFLLLLLATAFVSCAASSNLNFYRIDAEGGAATRIVTLPDELRARAVWIRAEGISFANSRAPESCPQGASK